MKLFGKKTLSQEIEECLENRGYHLIKNRGGLDFICLKFSETFKSVKKRLIVFVADKDERYYSLSDVVILINYSKIYGEIYFISKKPIWVNYRKSAKKHNVLMLTKEQFIKVISK